MKLEKKVFRNSGVEMSYAAFGKGKPVMFLHGAGITAMPYKKSLEMLSQKYFVIAPDLTCLIKPGTTKKIWALPEYAEFMNKFIDSLRLTRISIIGHSFGGGIAIYMAAKNKKISRLVLVDSTGMQTSQPMLKMCYVFIIKKNLANIFMYDSKGPMVGIITDFLSTMSRKLLLLPIIIKVLKKTVLDRHAVLSEIKTPTLILWGDKDELFPLQAAKALSKKIHKSTLRIVKGNHDWCIFKPEEFSGAVAGFIK